jgi:prepilin-type N-terminal cleavage/methylation domain-containing protein
MPISSAGSRSKGVTLLELVVVVAIIALMVGISFPAVTSGLDSLRLKSASDALVSFLNSGLNRCERRQEVVEVAISVKANEVVLHSSQPGFERKLELPEGVRIEAVDPKLESEEDPRRFILMPGGTVPRLGVQLANRRDQRRMVRVDPMTGVPQIEIIQ